MSILRNPALLSRLVGTPLMCEPNKASAIVTGLLLSDRFGFGVDLEKINATVIDDQGSAHELGLTPQALVTDRGIRSDNGNYRVQDGVALVEVFGVLAHRGGFQADSSYVLGYEELISRLQAAINDPSVKGIAAIFNTPGGEVSGAFQAADKIYQWRGTKPMVAIVDEMAASAGYLLASAFERVVTTDTAYSGSIGTKIVHVDLSKALADQGINPTEIFSGKHKADGSPLGPLTPEVKARYQSETDALRNQFAEAVATYRNLKVSAVLGTEADIYRGQDAVRLGLADALSTPDAALAELRAGFSTPTRTFTMQDDTPKPSNAADDLARVAAENQTQGATAERERIKAILTHESAKGRMEQAMAFAFDTDLKPEQTQSLLAKAPVANATGQSAFEQHMNAIANPAVQPGNGNAPDAGAQSKSLWASALNVQIQ